jgi:hypothetical protein
LFFGNLLNVVDFPECIWRCDDHSSCKEGLLEGLVAWRSRSQGEGREDEGEERREMKGGRKERWGGKEENGKYGKLNFS